MDSKDDPYFINKFDYPEMTNESNNNMILNDSNNRQSKPKTINFELNSEIKKIISKKYIKISIIDTGIGMKENEFKTLLKLEDNNLFCSINNLNREGSWLGLSKCKNLSDKLNHQIDIKSYYEKKVLLVS
jgi:hypothetical protein